MKSMKLDEMMAKACCYAQEHIDDKDAWSIAIDDRYPMLQCVSYQMACFFAQNTVDGKVGVEWDVVFSDLIEHPMKTEKTWLKIINGIAKDLGGWKN
jgi:hypothetical protein